MASSGKKKTTMAKLMRESRLRERRMDKQARKDARKQASAERPAGLVDVLSATPTVLSPISDGERALDTAESRHAPTKPTFDSADEPVPASAVDAPADRAAIQAPADA
jgi:hypothetical protein